jgi:hypothetical protein
MNLLLSILIIGALLTGCMFLTWKCGEFLAHHGDKFVKGAVLLTVILLAYVGISMWIHPLPGVKVLHDLVNAAGDVVKAHV